MFSNHPQQPKQPLPQYSGREYIMLQLRNIGRREPTGLPPMVFCLLENGWHSNGFHASGRKLCRCLSEYIYSVRLFFVSSPPIIYSSPPASVSPPAVLSSLSKTARPQQRRRKGTRRLPFHDAAVISRRKHRREGSAKNGFFKAATQPRGWICLLYTSDAADEL